MQHTKEDKKALQSLERLSNKIKLDHSLKRIVTLRDYLLAIGHTEEHIKEVLHYRENELVQPLSFPELKERLSDLKIALTTEQWLKQNPPQIELTLTPQSQFVDTTDLQTYAIVNGTDKDGKQISLYKPTSDELHILEKKDQDYGLAPSLKEKATLFWFQKQYAKVLLDGMLKDNYHAQLLIAKAGYGKTFIIGAVLRRLLDMQFHVGKTISLWPYIYVTKASVVEQTKRVLENSFSIDLFREVTVLNYDALRSSLGELYLKEETIIESGYEHRTWSWRKVIHPVVFILDECQAAKNEQSEQAKIISAISKIDNPNIYCIFSSATPFTRVSEAKYFVLNARMDAKLY